MKPTIEQDILSQFGNRLRTLRKKQGLSQEELGNLSQLDRTYIGGVERGERNISLQNIAKLANAIGISIIDFFR